VEAQPSLDPCFSLLYFPAKVPFRAQRHITKIDESVVPYDQVQEVIQNNVDAE
jgi:hypothetical protein